MPVILIPAIIGGTIVLIGGGYWLLHLQLGCILVDHLGPVCSMVFASEGSV